MYRFGLTWPAATVVIQGGDCVGDTWVPGATSIPYLASIEETLQDNVATVLTRNQISSGSLTNTTASSSDSGSSTLIYKNGVTVN